MRDKTLILKEFSIKICEGESIAIIGSSGCGKSSITQLLQRFYDVNKG